MELMYKGNIIETTDFTSSLVDNSIPYFKNLMSAKTLTAFDEIIFKEKVCAIRGGMPVQFETTVEANYRKIRATRLRILGYRWNKLDSCWKKS